MLAREKSSTRCRYIEEPNAFCVLSVHLSCKPVNLSHTYHAIINRNAAPENLHMFLQIISDWLKSLKERGHLEMNSISTASQLRSASGFRSDPCIALTSKL